MAHEPDDHLAGGWMQTFTGRRFSPLHPRPEDIDIVDIAHSLALQCRYNGHSVRHYSVAEHCVLVSRMVPPEHALVALLHDATEAYVGDLIRPVKIHVPQFQEIEDRVWRAIVTRYALEPELPECVDHADKAIVDQERRALLNDPKGWSWSSRERSDTPSVNVQGLPAHAAERLYLETFYELIGAHIEEHSDD